jgi:uncharacterized membrane protein
MTIAEKLKWFVLPSLIVIGIGILEIKYPHAMQGSEGGYAGLGGKSGFFVLTFKLFLMLTWGKIEGIILILLGILPIVICFFPFKEQVNESESNEKLRAVVAVSAFSVGKAYVQRRRRNRET